MRMVKQLMVLLGFMCGGSLLQADTSCDTLHGDAQGGHFACNEDRFSPTPLPHYDQNNNICSCDPGSIAWSKQVSCDPGSYDLITVNEWYCEPFQGGDFSDKQAQIDSFNKFANLNMEGANFEGINFNGKYMTGAFLKGANLKGTKFENGVTLYGAVFINANLTNADFRGVNNIRGAHFEGADLNGAHFENLGKQWDGTAFVKAPYAWASFKGAKNIDKAHFDGADLTDVIWIDGHNCKAGSIGVCK